jgi:hypothetical protein
VLTIVVGPPCSGKSTYVKTHAKPGDITIDFDTLAQALGSPTPHDHAADIRNITIAMRRSAIDAAVELHHHGATVWIVDCNPNPYRLRLYKANAARFVILRVDTGELHKRASVERPPLWHRLIDEWVPPVGLSGTTVADPGLGSDETVAASRPW